MFEKEVSKNIKITEPISSYFNEIFSIFIIFVFVSYILLLLW